MPISNVNALPPNRRIKAIISLLTDPKRHKLLLNLAEAGVF